MILEEKKIFDVFLPSYINAQLVNMYSSIEIHAQQVLLLIIENL